MERGGISHPPAPDTFAARRICRGKRVPRKPPPGFAASHPLLPPWKKRGTPGGEGVPELSRARRDFSFHGPSGGAGFVFIFLCMCSALRGSALIPHTPTRPKTRLGGGFPVGPPLGKPPPMDPFFQTVLPDGFSTILLQESPLRTSPFEAASPQGLAVPLGTAGKTGRPGKGPEEGSKKPVRAAGLLGVWASGRPGG